MANALHYGIFFRSFAFPDNWLSELAVVFRLVKEIEIYEWNRFYEGGCGWFTTEWLQGFFFFFGHLAVEILGLGSCHCTFCRWRAWEGQKRIRKSIESTSQLNLIMGWIQGYLYPLHRYSELIDAGMHLEIPRNMLWVVPRSVASAVKVSEKFFTLLLWMLSICVERYSIACS